MKAKIKIELKQGRYTILIASGFDDMIEKVSEMRVYGPSASLRMDHGVVVSMSDNKFEVEIVFKHEWHDLWDRPDIEEHRRMMVLFDQLLSNKNILNIEYCDSEGGYMCGETITRGFLDFLKQEESK